MSESGQRSEQTTYKRDEQGKFTSAAGEASGAPPGGPAAALALAGAGAPAGPGAGEPPQFSSLLTHVGERVRAGACARARARGRVRAGACARARLRAGAFARGRVCARLRALTRADAALTPR